MGWTSYQNVIFLLIFIFVSVNYIQISNAALDEYSEEYVFHFINRSRQLKEISTKCKDALGRIKSYLNDKETLEAQRIYYSQSFSTGPNNFFLSRDQDRWVYRGYECLLSAGETIYSKSEHPMHYCYSHDDDKDKNITAYSICIPSPCADDNEMLLKEWRRLTEPKDAEKPMHFTSCTRSRHEKQWFEQLVPLTDLAFNIMLTMFIAMATSFHYVKGGEQVKGWGPQLMLAFSLKTNVKKLIELPKDPQSCITCMFGIRFLSMVWTLIGHSFIFIQAYLENVEEFKDTMANSFWNQWITNFTLSVDTFFVLGGTVLSYSWFRKWLKNNSEPEPSWTSYGYWLKFYRHRVVRLWPAYLYTVLAVTLRLSVTHYHPMWPPTDPAIQCPIHWWENALFVNSLFNNRCMPWTWYIGTEFIYYIISPIFLLSLRKRPKLGFLLCILTIAASAGLNTWSMIENNFPPTQLLWKQPDIFNHNFIQHHIEIYIKPQFRIGPYIIGILLGYYLACYQRKTIKPERSNNHIAGVWIVGLGCTLGALYGLYPSLHGWNWPIYHLVYGTIHRDVFAVGISFIIYACHTGIGGFVNRLLSHYVLLPLSNLCFTAYLFHMIPVVFTYLLVPFPIWFDSQIPIFIHCVVQLLLTYVFAIICTLSVEYPALNIERMLLHPAKNKTTLKPAPTSDSELQLKPSSPKL
ncbi:hypothetical protein WR25_18616 [Diploscapter pachys]|uniref:Acyltransferase 3 domain-containing protein n=1 Tax=Diploscapter pachys TaxID=2018661 RepID=A0A2A2LMW3_9BILA|nr:hypothetical protein WR25_18616 [Diploscapter pachys]